MTNRKAIQEKRQRDQQRRRIYAILIVVGVVVVVGGFFVLLQLRPAGGITQITPKDYPNAEGRAMGNPDAPVVLEEFGDFQCPHCKSWFEDVETLVVENYVESGDVYFVYRNFPVLGPESLSAANASMCAADQDGFWEYHDILFVNQSGSNSGNFSDRRLVAFAENLGLDTESFEACLNENRFMSEVEDDFSTGQLSGITGTPGILINGVLVDSSYQAISQQIDAALWPLQEDNVSNSKDLMANPVHLEGEMDLEEFRRAGYQLIDWIAEYLAHPERYPVLSRSQPGEITANLPSAPPLQGEPMDQILADFEEILLPGITHWNHPGFFSYFAQTGSGPGILAELLTAGLNVNGMLWRTSPAATELEEVTLDWLRQMLGLPPVFKGIIVDSASLSSLLALAAAREATNLEIRARGMAGRADLPRLQVYVSDQTHSSIEKDAITLGLGQENVRKIPTDAQFRMDSRALAEAIQADFNQGLHPFCVVATVGTTSATSIDPVPEIAAICRQHNLWLHVDGAYGAMAAVLPEKRSVLDGCEAADSLVVNAHKWGFVPKDASAFYVRDPEALKRAFSLVPEYLQTSEVNVTNYMDWGVQLGRPFRSLKLWMVLRHFGQEGLAARLRYHIELAQELAGWIDADPNFTRTAPTPFSIVCFRAEPAELAEQLEEGDPESRQELESYLKSLNQEIIDRVNASGEAYLSHTILKGRYTMRMAIGNIRSDREIIARTWTLIQEVAATIMK